MKIFLRMIRMRRRATTATPVGLFVRAVAILMAAGALHLVLFKFIEQVSWNESLWQTWQTFTTVGYGNRPAETGSGRWVTILFGTLGIAFLGVIISQAFDLKQERREKRRLGMLSNPFRNGVVIFNYPGEVRLLNMIRELRHHLKNAGFCIVDEKLVELPEKIARMDGVAYIRGELLKEETYHRAALDQNPIVVVFPTVFGQSSSDALTQLVVRKAAKFMGEAARLVYVQVDPANDWLFRDCAGTSVSESFEVLAVVQEATDPFSSALVEDMFQNTSGANPQTVVPRKVIGWSWFDFHATAIETGRRRGVRINPFGLVKKGTATACPPFDVIIEAGDLLSVIVDSGFDWQTFESAMAAVRKEREAV